MQWKAKYNQQQIWQPNAIELQYTVSIKFRICWKAFIHLHNVAITCLRIEQDGKMRELRKSLKIK